MNDLNEILPPDVKMKISVDFDSEELDAVIDSLVVAKSNYLEESQFYKGWSSGTATRFRGYATELTPIIRKLKIKRDRLNDVEM